MTVQSILLANNDDWYKQVWSDGKTQKRDEFFVTVNMVPQRTPKSYEHFT